MATDLRTAAESASASVSDIIRDAQELLSQQLAMFRAEVRDDFRKARDATIPMALGGVVAFVGVILLCLMLVHLLVWAWPELPLWGAYGIVGGVMAVVGAGAFYAGKKQFEQNNPLPDKSVHALKENVQWLSQPK